MSHNSQYSVSEENKKSNITFGNQQKIFNNNNINNIEYSKENLSKIINQNFSPTQSFAFNYSYNVPVKSP